MKISYIRYVVVTVVCTTIMFYSCQKDEILQTSNQFQTEDSNHLVNFKGTKVNSPLNVPVSIFAYKDNFEAAQAMGLIKRSASGGREIASDFTPNYFEILEKVAQNILNLMSGLIH